MYACVCFIPNFWQYFPAYVVLCAMHYGVGEHIHVFFGLFFKYLDEGFLRELLSGLYSCFHTEFIYRGHLQRGAAQWFSID